MTDAWEDICKHELENVGTKDAPYYICRKCPAETDNIEQQDEE